jgi:hypothetical protein
MNPKSGAKSLKLKLNPHNIITSTIAVKKLQRNLFASYPAHSPLDTWQNLG